MKKTYGDKYKKYQTRFCNWRRKIRHTDKEKKARAANEE
jgi:hypothetical protein